MWRHFADIKGAGEHALRRLGYIRGYAKKAAMPVSARSSSKASATPLTLAEREKDKDKMPTPAPVLRVQKIPVYAGEAFGSSLPSERAPPSVFSLSPQFQNKMKSYEYPRQLFKEFKLFDQKNLLVRSETAELLRRITYSDGDGDAKRVIYLDGAAGVGKTCVLLQLVNVVFEARSHFIVYIPDAHQFTQGRFPYYLGSDLRAGDGEDENGRVFVQPELAQHMLRGMLALNAEHFEQGGALHQAELKLRHLGGERTWLVKSAIEHAMGDMVTATSYFSKIMDYLFSEECALPVLLAVDQVNALSAQFEYFGTDSERLTAKAMPVIATVSKYFDTPSLVKRGSTAIGALSYTDTRIWTSRLKRQLRADLQAGADGAYAHCLIAPFSKDETRSMLKYYRGLGLLYEDAIEGGYSDTKYYISGGNGRKLFQSCSMDNIY